MNNIIDDIIKLLLIFIFLVNLGTLCVATGDRMGNAQVRLGTRLELQFSLIRNSFLQK